MTQREGMTGPVDVVSVSTGDTRVLAASFRRE
jgi:hypothetical protein